MQNSDKERNVLQLFICQTTLFLADVKVFNFDLIRNLSNFDKYE